MDGMAKNVVIVESPAKAKTIEGYLGPDYQVVSSFGHIRDLPKKGLSIDLEKDFEPTYQISPEKKKTVSELKKAVKAATTVWLASDEDREGEAIAWHLCKALGLDEKTTKRIVFHEITKSAITEALQHPRVIDQPLVDAQQARRVLDRLVGYELSPVLWRKIRPGLSAGRVQSVAVRIIVDREREILAFEPSSTFRVTGNLLSTKKELIPVEAAERIADIKLAKVYLEAVAKSRLTVQAVDQTPGTRRPSAPFTTSTLQQEASRRLGYPVRYTMSLAQELYEAGKITYMRTDSVNISELAITQAEKVITAQFGKEFAQPTRYQTKSRGAQEAHEAIRPSDLSVEKAGGKDAAAKLYQLIRNRALASQMAPAKIEKTTVTITVSEHQTPLVAKGEVLVFAGWLALGGASDDVILPALQTGDELTVQDLLATETFARPPARYSESTLVRKLEELGIGRPSTYAPTVSTIQDRGYVEKGQSEGEERAVQVLRLEGQAVQTEQTTERSGANQSKLVPTPTGEQVTDFLVKNFPEIVDYSFTAGVEDNLDDVEDGKLVWQKLVKDFYGPFHKTVEAAADVKRSEAAQARLVGQDPKSGEPIYARYGRYGPMLQRGESDDEADKPTFAPLPPGERIESVDLKTALKAFSLPRSLGKTSDGLEVSAHIGRFGPYLKVGDAFVSLKEDDPYTVTLERAYEVIAEHAKREAERYIQRFTEEKIDVVNGRYGPYITDGKKNAKIPKDTKPEDITVEVAKKLLAEAPAKGKGRFGRRAKARKKK